MTLDEYNDKRDLKEFRRLRNYYRNNFTNGDSDQSFVLWVESMCEIESGESVNEENN